MVVINLLSILTIPFFCLSFHLILASHSKIKPTKLQVVFSTLLYSLAIVLCNFNDINELSIIFIMVFVLSLFYYNDISKQILMTIITYLFYFFIDLAYGILVELLEIDYLATSQFKVIIFRLFITLISFTFWNFRKSRKNQFQIHQSMIILGVAFFYVQSLNNNINSLYYLFYTLIFTIILFLNFYVYEKLYQSMAKESQNKMLNQQSLAILNQKELIDQSLYTISSLKHDIKNQLITILALQKNNSQEAIDFTNNLLLEMDSVKPISNSNHFIIDSIINFKLQQVDPQKIDIKLNLKIPVDLPILAYDITIVLGNLLDNSITALHQFEGDRRILVSITIRYGVLIILIENSYDGNLKLENGQYHTTKHLGANHGFGLNNVKNVVTRLHGELEISHSSDIFTVEITIPLGEI